MFCLPVILVVKIINMFSKDDILINVDIDSHEIHLV